MKIFKIIKNFICNSEIRMNYINKIGFYNKMDDKKYILKEWKVKMKTTCNIEAPKSFNEKLQYLKLYNRKPEYTDMVDKYEAKNFVSKIIGEEYIIPTIGIYKKFKNIDFEKLPNKFVLKPTHTSGDIFICKDKEKINNRKLRKQVKKWLKRKYYYIHREWPYKNIKPRIIAEKYMATDDQPELLDYKFFCFNGEPKFLYVSEGLSDHSTAKISFVDMDYKMAEFHRKDYKPFDKLPKQPENFEEMKELARKLSQNIPFVRVDFYEVEGKTYFGELTFYPGSGYIPFEPEEYDKVLGDMLELPKEKLEEKNEK